ncbi:hypothetical protein ACLBYG_28320 [Methylobacterium sp. D53M]
MSHSDELWMNNKNTFGKLTDLRDTNSYPTPRRVKIAPRIRITQAGTGTTTDAVPIGGEAISIPKPGLAAGAIAGGIALHELDVLREDRAVQNAAQQLDLNLQNTNDVLAARLRVGKEHGSDELLGCSMVWPTQRERGAVNCRDGTHASRNCRGGWTRRSRCEEKAGGRDCCRLDDSSRIADHSDHTQLKKE